MVLIFYVVFSMYIVYTGVGVLNLSCLYLFICGWFPYFPVLLGNWEYRIHILYIPVYIYIRMYVRAFIYIVCGQSVGGCCSSLLCMCVLSPYYVQ
jgi:hypothetical protein